MPCNSDHMNPMPNEVIASQCLTLIDELNGLDFAPDNYEGYHPDAYGKGLTNSHCDKLTAQLCKKLQETDVTKYSLEMQMWWRDHQKADKERLEKEIESAKKESDKKKALAKLTPYERELLGYKEDNMPF